MSYADGVALLPRLVALYMRQSPEARVHLDAGYEPELVQKLKDGELDFAILENQPTEPGIVTEALGYKKLVFLAPDKAPYNQTLGPVPIETLLKWPMIVYEWHSGRHMVGTTAISGSATASRCATKTWWAASTPTRPWWRA